VYYIGTDITKNDLEKKNRNASNTILNGRQITDMAKRALQDYCKALSFTTDKWDFKKSSQLNLEPPLKILLIMFIAKCT
jgi:hypothetical protein